MVSQKNFLLLVLLVIGVVLLQPVSAAETATAIFYPVPTTARIIFISGSAFPTSGLAPLTVQFNDTSRYKLTSWDWDFGDGDHSNLKNLSYTYLVPGIYNVTLKQRNVYGTPTKIATITVINPTPVFIPNITATISCPMVYFAGTSTGDPTSWSWNFGDGTTSTEQNPVHTYSTNGNYTVTLTVSGQSGSSSISKQFSNSCVVPVSNVTITTWTKDGEYTVAGAEVYLGKNGRLLGKTGIDGSVTVSVPYDTPSLYAKSPVYRDSYFYEGSWTLVRTLQVPPPMPSPTPSPISISLDQRVDHYVFTDANNGGTVSMKSGSTLSLELHENGGSTGYLWVLTTTPGLNVTGDSFIAIDRCCGFGGTRTWEMTADATGQQQIVAVSKRSWEPATGQENTFRITINVT